MDETYSLDSYEIGPSPAKEALKLYEDFIKRYNKVAIVFNNGMFSELYALVDENGNIRGNVFELAELLNLRVAKRDNSIPAGPDNHYMAGWPIAVGASYIETLINNNYTVVKVVQIPCKRGEKPKRKIEMVMSAGTVLDSPSANSVGTNNIVSIYIETQKFSKPIRFMKDCESIPCAIGFVVIDLITGKNSIAESYSLDSDILFPIQELYRFLVAHNPREIIIKVEKLDDQYKEIYQDFLDNYLDLRRYSTVMVHFNMLNKNFLKISYQDEFFNKVFSQKNSDSVIKKASIIADLNIDKYNYGIISYMIIIQYIYEHNPTLIKSINRPNVHWSTDKLELTHNAILQLHLVPENTNVNSFKPNNFTSSIKNKPKNQYDSILSVINKTLTKPGKRLLLSLLMSPLTDVDIIIYFHDLIEALIERKSTIASLNSLLENLPDLENLHHKINLLIIKPMELTKLYHGYHKVNEIFSLLNKTKNESLIDLLPSDEEIKELHKAEKLIYTTFLVDNLAESVIENGKITSRSQIVRSGVDPTLDGYINDYNEADNEIKSIVAHLNNFIVPKNAKSQKGVVYDWVKPSKRELKEKDKENKIKEKVNSVKPPEPKLKTKVVKKTNKANKEDKNDKLEKKDSTEDVDSESEEKDDFECEIDDEMDIPIIYATQSKINLIKKSTYDKKKCGELEFVVASKSQTRITSKRLDELIHTLCISRTSIMDRQSDIYKSVIDSLNENNSYSIPINRFIARIDYANSGAKCAIEYNYFRPVIDESKGPSYFHGQDLRHPLIERINSNTAYIENDVYLSGGKEQGYLIYGCNSSGKSSLIRMVAVNVILNAIGYYCSGKVKTRIFKKIITRLASNDNLLSSQSSFIVEMIEVRTVLNNADPSSLIIVDEACRGTESISANALSMSLIEELVDSEASFMFCTHLHNLATSPHALKLVNESKLRICHLTTIYDPTTELLLFERKLKEGPGPSSYGINVCKYLGLKKTFVDRAEEIRKELNGDNAMLVNPKQSSYNSSVYMDRCLVCKKKCSLEAHHLKPQKDADKNGFIGNMHKNHQSNLVVLCNECHDKLHNKKNALKIVSKDIGRGDVLYQIKTD